MESPLTAKALAQQEAVFRECYEKGDIFLGRALYHPDLVYVSPTFRIIDRPSWIMTGIEAGLDFIQATLSGIPNIRYEAVSTAIVPGGRTAFAQIHFDWDAEGGGRVRSNYVSLYRYHEDGRIVQQEIYYDPTGVLSDPTVEA